jgi:hypothetical protein
MKCIIAAIFSFFLSSCAGLVGVIDTPYGAVEFDGEKVQIIAKPIIIPSK